MSKIKTSGYARFVDDELEFGGVGYYSRFKNPNLLDSSFSKSKTKEHRGKPDGEKSKGRKKDYTEERKVKRGE